MKDTYTMPSKITLSWFSLYTWCGHLGSGEDGDTKCGSVVLNIFTSEREDIGVRNVHVVVAT
eukprot:3653373-Amphidinium_carterae.1